MNMPHSDQIPASGDGAPSRPSFPHGEAWPPSAQAAFNQLAEELADELAQLRNELREWIETDPPSPRQRELLTPEEAADVLRISRRSVETMIAAGDLSVMDVGPNGGKRLIHRDNLDAYLRESVRQ
jgi:excisionase family DNA binding protein